jgi:hypothetical protein
LDTTENVTFQYWGKNQGWQLGALNSTLQSLKLAANSIQNCEEFNVIFTHEDVHPKNLEKIDGFLNLLERYDLIVRSHTGRWCVKGFPYYMLEDIFMRGEVLHNFKDIGLIAELLHNSAEITFGNLVSNMNLSVLEIPFSCGSLLEEENEFGFIHKS